MALGDLIVGPSYPQYEWNGVSGTPILLGSGTNWIVERVSGLLGIPDLRSSDLARQGGDGDFPGRNYYAGRKLIFDVTITATTPSTRESYLVQIDNLFQTSDFVGKLAYQRLDGVKRFVWAVVEKVDFDSNSDVAAGLIKGSIQFKCPDPLIYSVVEAATTISVPNAALTSSMVPIINSGTAFNWPRFDIAGPITNPRVANATDGGKQFKYDGVIISGDVLQVDFRSQKAILVHAGSYADSSGLIRSDSQWFRFLSGENDITVSRSVSAAQSDTTFYSRSSWGGRRF